MNKLLDGKIQYNPGQLLESPVASMSLALSNLSKDIATYVHWMNKDVTHVAADHWLVSFINIALGRIGYRPEMTPQEIFQRADLLSTELARVFGFTTEYSAGRLHISDNGAVTVYVIGKSPYRKKVLTTTQHWELVPMRYLAHSSTSLSMGNHAEPEELVGCGYDVIELDLGILQYQAVQFMNYWTTRNPEAPRNLQQLVAMHVLPKLKQTQYDIAIMNRLTNMINGGPINNTVYRLPKTFADRHAEMDRNLQQVLDFALGRELSFTQAISLLPTALKNNPFVTLSYDDYLETSAIGWALLLARYGLLNYLFSICRVEASRARRWPINAFERQVRRLLNTNTLSAVLNLTNRKEFMDKLQVLFDQAKV